MSESGHYSESLGHSSHSSHSSPSSSSSSADSDLVGLTAQERKRQALFPPIASVCSALGGYEEFRDEQGNVYTEYSLGDSVIGCLKDLKRFWRMDERDDDRTVARIFAQVGVLKNDLIPISLSTLGTSIKGDRIALACVELIGALTWPIDVTSELHDAKQQDHLVRARDYHSLIDAQLGYKAALLRSGCLRAMFALMSPSLGKMRKERTTKDDNIISLTLHVFRNLSLLSDRPLTSSSPSSDAIEFSQLQSELISQFEREHIFDLLVAIAASEKEFGEWNFVALEVLSLVFRGVRVEELMVEEEEEIAENRLENLLREEDRSKRGNLKKTTTRHSRFGTTVALKTGSRQYILHKQSTLTEGPERTMDKIKRNKAKKVRENDDLQPPSNLTPKAIRTLRKVALAFIDSAFNPFFSSILKDIRMERSKVKESDTVRFLFLSSFFLQFFLLVYKEQEKKGVDMEGEEWRDLGLISEMTEPMTIGFITNRMKKALEEKPPMWTELHAGVDCFVQILLVIEALQLSPHQEYTDVAEVLQNKLYYEEETLNMVLDLVVKYHHQSVKFLDSVMLLSYTLLRLLEKYSKSKSYMYVRKKKTRVAKRRKKANVEDEEGDGIGMGDEEDEVDRHAISYKEHAFAFADFEDKFANENVLQTCMVYLEGYRDFKNPEQMKRVVSLMHRQAVKAKCEGLFFKPTVLELFQRILADETILMSREPATIDLRKLIEYILKKFFKAVKEAPLLLVEIFYPKTKNQLGKMKMGELDPYASSDDDGPSGARMKLIGEVEVTPGFSITQQIGIAVAVLVDADQKPLVDFVLTHLTAASSSRKEVVMLTDGDNEAMEDESDSDEAIRRKAGRLLGPSKDAIALFMAHNVDFSDEAEKRAAATNANFKLLMRLLKWESAEVPDSDELTWTIPSDVLPASLDTDHKIITDFLLDPVDPANGKSAADLLRKKRKKPIRKRRERSPNEEGGEGDEDEAPKKRAKKRKEEAQAYKSAQFIEDSDDEDNPEKDAIFFAAEAALRAQLAQSATAAQVLGGGGIALSKGTKRKKAKKDDVAEKESKKKEKKGKKVVERKTFEEVSDIEDDGGVIEKLRQHAAAAATNGPQGDNSDEEGEPSASRRESSTEHQSSSSGAPSRKRGLSVTSASSEPPATEVKSTQPANDEVTAYSDEDEEPVVKQTKKRRVILDSDDDE